MENVSPKSVNETILSRPFPREDGTQWLYANIPLHLCVGLVCVISFLGATYRKLQMSPIKMKESTTKGSREKFRHIPSRFFLCYFTWSCCQIHVVVCVCPCRDCAQTSHLVTYTAHGPVKHVLSMRIAKSTHHQQADIDSDSADSMGDHVLWKNHCFFTLTFQHQTFHQRSTRKMMVIEAECGHHFLTFSRKHAMNGVEGQSTKLPVSWFQTCMIRKHC